ncbi:hypothetical protein [Streptomyces malaysiensis]|uniref:hypothetical protein n=1 Tax=Streptomyces malaysiensis TaxID=92644 RepID=UPI002B2B047E|nr:hypothetical protein R8789_04695 [Streptomyces malaysiensis]
MAIAHHVPASTVDAPSVPFPSDRRTPLTWSTAPIADAGGHPPTVLEWHSAVPAAPGRLRLFVACDVRDVRRVEAASARTGRPLGSFDIRYADCHQPYDLPLDGDAVRAVADEGVRLALASDPATEPLWIFSGPDAPVERRPSLLLDTEDPSAPAAALHHHLTSIASVQPFGWMEGCVLDALYDLHTTFPADTRAETALRDHLAVYVHGIRLRYEDPRSRPANDRVYGIEATLPFAVVAKRDPRTPRSGWPSTPGTPGPTPMDASRTPRPRPRAATPSLTPWPSSRRPPGTPGYARRPSASSGSAAGG